MSNKSLLITLDDDEVVEAQAPVIVSASRYTDIPAWYADWFLERLKQGYSIWRNPFNAKRSYVAYDNTRLIVFWSKNPEPLLKHGGCLDYLEERNINTYIHYTLNDYEGDGLEPNLPSLNERIDTFKHLVDRLGFGKVIWRFDPMILTKRIGVEELMAKVENIAHKLHGYTEKLVFSYADIKAVRGVRTTMKLSGVKAREIVEEDMHRIALGLQSLNSAFGYQLAACSEHIDLSAYGISRNRCIDEDLIVRHFSHDRALMEHLGVELTSGSLFDAGELSIKRKNNKDKQRRDVCGCIASKDIGQSDTCMYMCPYCFSNTRPSLAELNYMMHKDNPHRPTINGK